VLRTDSPNLAPLSDPIAAVVHAAATHNVDAVYVAGRAVKQDGVLVAVDVAGVLERATASHEYLVKAAR
jgi:cytosine/adenosine deaminase-related metal-dependent hydrolase